MDFNFEDIKNKSKVELLELLAEQQSGWREAKFKARSKQLKQVHIISNFKKTIARIMTVLGNNQKSKKSIKQ